MSEQERNAIYFYLAILCALMFLLIGSCNQEIMATPDSSGNPPTPNDEILGGVGDDDTDSNKSLTLLMLKQKLKSIEDDAAAMQSLSVDCAARPVNIDESSEVTYRFNILDPNERPRILINRTIQLQDVPVDNP
jgi:hypothetical protein